MADRHLSAHLIQELLHGHLPQEEQVWHLVEHLAETCEQCRRELTAALPKGRPSGAHHPAVGAALEASEAQVPDLEELRAEAERDLKDLLRAPAVERQNKVQRALSRFRNPVLVELLIEESRRQVTVDAFAAHDLAVLAHDVAFRLSQARYGKGWAATLIARATAYQGNALRAAGELRRAEQLLEFAHGYFSREGTLDPLVTAELHHMLAALRSDQRRFSEAERLLEEARQVYERCGEWQLLGRLLVGQAVAQSEAGQVEKAVATAHEALRTLDLNRDRKLYLCAEHNLTDYLQELGRFDEAEARYRRNQALYEEFPEAWIQLRRQWLAGRIARGLHDLGLAEQIFLRLREQFADKELSFHVALVGLDLALVFIAQGRDEGVAQLADEMLPIFLAQDLRREATAALLLFEEAAKKRAVTLTMVEELILHLRRSQRGL
jgi:tetratricopeptide (TPR) repeat protein